MYDTIAQLLRLAEERDRGLWEIILENEIKLLGLDEDAIFQRLDKHYEVMLRSESACLNENSATGRGLISGISSR